jgi:hypothetical protein
MSFGRPRLARLVAVTAALCVVACGGGTEVGRDEVARVTSPDGALDAVLIETNGGATTSFGYDIEVVPRAGKADAAAVATLYGATRNGQAYGANLRWVGARELSIEYLQASWTRQKETTATVGNEKITVVLHPGVTDNSAPPGGMAYNLRR